MILLKTSIKAKENAGAIVAIHNGGRDRLC